MRVAIAKIYISYEILEKLKSREGYLETSQEQFHNLK